MSRRAAVILDHPDHTGWARGAVIVGDTVVGVAPNYRGLDLGAALSDAYWIMAHPESMVQR